MNEKQRDNLAKCFYDIGKGVLLITVVNPFITGKTIALDLIIGGFIGVGCLFVGHLLNY